MHRSSRLDVARHPARTPPRTRIHETVLDLVEASATFADAYEWMSAACSNRLVTPDQLRAAAIGRPTLRRRADVLGALEDVADGVFSNLERHFVNDVERPHGLPAPVRQACRKRGSRSAYLDNLYVEFCLAVELDGLVAHPADKRWRDIYRDNDLAAQGITTLRYSWADVTERPCGVAAQIAAALRARGWTGTPRRCSPSCQAG